MNHKEKTENYARLLRSVIGYRLMLLVRWTMHTGAGISVA